MNRTRRTLEPWTRIVLGFGWAALSAAAASGFAPQREQPRGAELGLGEVRADFASADADGDRRLDREQALSGGIAGEHFARYDADADGKLDGDEYLVARQALAARAGRAAAADLGAESTRIQAAWRARRSPGPSSRVDAARRDPSEVQPAPAGAPPVSGSTAAAPRAPAKLPATTAGDPAAPGLGLSRLRQNTRGNQARGDGAEASSAPSSLEARARSAQELILERRKLSGAPARTPVIADPSRGPASRTSMAGTSSGTQRAQAPASSRLRTQPVPKPAAQPKPAAPAPSARPQKPQRSGPSGGS